MQSHHQSAAGSKLSYAVAGHSAGVWVAQLLNFLFKGGNLPVTKVLPGQRALVAPQYVKSSSSRSSCSASWGLTCCRGHRAVQVDASCWCGGSYHLRKSAALHHPASRMHADRLWRCCAAWAARRPCISSPWCRRRHSRRLVRVAASADPYAGIEKAVQVSPQQSCKRRIWVAQRPCLYELVPDNIPESKCLEGKFQSCYGFAVDKCNHWRWQRPGWTQEKGSDTAEGKGYQPLLVEWPVDAASIMSVQTLTLLRRSCSRNG